MFAKNEARITFLVIKMNKCFKYKPTERTNPFIIQNMIFGFADVSNGFVENVKAILYKRNLNINQYTSTYK
ncbi:unnamed protein product, partial [Leptidea sinapis]